MPNEKIVQALRVCGSMMNCTECPLENKDWCTRTMMLSAADLIEQQMEEIKELTEGIKKLEKTLAAFGQTNKELREIVPEWTPIRKAPPQMERLTEKHYHTTDYCMKCGEFATCPKNCEHCPELDRIVARLGAYEDTGLTPEDLKSAFDAKNVLRLAELVLDVRAGRLRVLAQADKEQRVVVLPVPPGCSFSTDNMLYIIEDGEIYEDSLYEATVGVSERGYTNVTYTTLDSQLGFEQADIGKTVFLTREEAERALENAE